MVLRRLLEGWYVVHDSLPETKNYDAQLRQINAPFGIAEVRAPYMYSTKLY